MIIITRQAKQYKVVPPEGTPKLFDTLTLALGHAMYLKANIHTHCEIVNKLRG